MEKFKVDLFFKNIESCRFEVGPFIWILKASEGDFYTLLALELGC